MNLLEKTFSTLAMTATLLAITNGCKVANQPQVETEPTATAAQIATQKIALKSTYFTSRFPNQKSAIADDVVEFNGDVHTFPNGQSSYFICDIMTEPFKLDKTSLLLDLQTTPEIAGQFYIKGKNAADKNVVSYYTSQEAPIPNGHIMLTAGKNQDGFNWFGSDVSGELDDDIVRIELYALVVKNGNINIKCSNIETGGAVPTMKKIITKDHGVTVKAGTHRGTFATQDADGNDTVVMWLMDDLNRRNLQINAVTGECTVVPLPPTNTPNAVYSAIISKDDRIYSLVGCHMLEYDPKTKSFTADHTCPHPVAMSMAEGPDGTIWAASYPDSGLVAFNPQTRVFTDYGCINSERWAQYPRTTVAHTDGWIYVGIGNTNGQVVAFNPTERKAICLMDAEHRPNPSTYNIYTYSDGNVYALSDDKNAFMFRLENGKATLLDKAPDAKPVPQRTGTQYYVQDKFPSGRILKSFQEVDMRLVTTDADGKDEKVINFSYPATHCGLMGVDVTEDGVFGGGGFFPFRFGTVDLATGKKIDQFCDEQCNTIVAHGKYFYIGGYCGGQLMRFDPRKPWTLETPMDQKEPRFDTNPIFYGKADPVVNRPHTIAITPEGDKFIVGGTPAYGMTGGGIAIINVNTNKVDIIGHEQLAQYEAPYSLAPLGNGKLVIGTTVAPGTGGAVKAKGSSLLVFDMNENKLLWKAKYGNGNCGNINALIALDNGMVLGLAAYEMFIFDPVNFKVVKQEAINGHGGYVGGQGPKILHKDDKGNVYIAFRSGLGKVDQENCTISKVLNVPGGIGVGGGIYQNRFYYSTGTRMKSITLDYFDDMED